MEMPKTKEEFECLMKERAMKMAGFWYRSFNIMIRCDGQGNPLRSEDKKTMCEMQKVALGSERGYMKCGPVEVYQSKEWGDSGNDMARDQNVKEGETIRVLHFYLDEAEEKEYHKIFFPAVIDKKYKLPETGWSGGNSGDFCAFPGGCE